MAETPVTQAQFALWTGSKAYDEWCQKRGQTERHSNEFAGNPEHPAENVTWHEAVGYCAWLSTQWEAGVPGDLAAGLPSEAQWEYACRARTDTEYCSGDGPGALDKVGWYDGNSGGRTRAVGGKAANAFGLHDMHGNVDEWCRDAWYESAYRRRERYDGIADPEVTEAMVGEADPDRVVRGGSWIGRARYCRSAFRFWRWPDDRGRFQGFRVCLFPGP